MLNQILFEQKEQDRLIRVEHTLQKAQLTFEQKLTHLTQESSNIFEFVYLLKNQKDSILKKFLEVYVPEKHGKAERLRIMNSYLNSKDVDFLLENAEKYFPSLIELNLATNTSFDNAALKKLFQPSTFHNLTILNLKNNKLLTDNIFADISELTTIRELNLNNTGVSDKGLHVLVKSKLFENLHTLVLSRNHQMINLNAFVSEDAARAKNLKHLDLSFTKIIPEGYKNLRKIPFISNLEVLDLSDNREIIEDSELKVLYNFQQTNDNEAPVKFNLKRLYLKNIRLTTDLLNVWLANDLSQLEFLDLEGNENLFNDMQNETDLKNASILNQLTTLSIRKTNLSQKSAAIFIPQLKVIKNLDLSQNELLNDEAISTIFKILLDNLITLNALGLGALNLSQNSVKSIFSDYLKVVETLKYFYVRENLSLKDEVVNSILSAKNLQLSYLNISACDITNDAYVQLLSAPDLLTNIEDIRLSENNQIDPDSVLINLVPLISKLTKLRRISLGSSFSLNSEIPKEIVNSQIQIQPFFCDDLD